MTKLLALVLLVLLVSVHAKAHPTLHKIQHSLNTSLETKNYVNVFISLQNGSTIPILRALESSKSFQSITAHEQKTTTVAQILRAHAEISQKPLLDFLKVNFPQIQIKSFWVNNLTFLKNVNKQIVETLAALDFVDEIREEQTTRISKVFDGLRATSLEQRLIQAPEAWGFQKVRQAPEWGLVDMRVPEVWNTGNTGKGLVVGNIDSGVRATHVLLSSKWVGLDNHGWYDPVGLSDNPHDIYNHGTHTMGMLVGGDGVGIVPDATWLACKGIQDDGTGTEAGFIACIEYMLCPTDYLGNNPDCSKAPHVVSNSWGFAGNNDIFNSAIYAWNAAGILSSFSAGNEAFGGRLCGSIRSPADQAYIAAVGATDSNHTLATFSSLGASRSNGLLKPEISAPGVDIYSASSESDTAMMFLSGTSMACPSTSGVLALLKNQDPNLIQARAIEILEITARRFDGTAGRVCDGVSESTYPNNHMGHGIIDAYAASLELTGAVQ